MVTKIQREQAREFVPNVDRLVRSAMADERYCCFIMESIFPMQVDWSLTKLNNFWKRASQSDLTVQQFIEKERKR